jgi:predicted enzyme related to lactoylglutathione lyase
MSIVTDNQPDGTPTWIDLGIPDLERAMDFYRAIFGWDYEVGTPDSGHYTMCLLGGRPVAALMQNAGSDATAFWWNVYLATSDVARTADRITNAGGTIVVPPMDVIDAGRMAIATDPVGAQFGLWQGHQHVGCQVVNEPNSLVRNDLVTAVPDRAREFYAAVFDLTLDRNADMPDLDFTFLRRPDGHEVGGIFGLPDAPKSAWATTFEVSDTDATVARAIAAGGSVGDVQDIPYGRTATLTDPFGTEFSVIARPAAEAT